MTTINAEDLVVRATTELFARDSTVVDRYFSETYIQHSTVAPDSVDGARALTATLRSRSATSASE